ncbi:MAG TPA: cytochrome P460 family protein [Candidatus Sulfotelmatobacter sp.]|nr:cytochrome P460 family protein [Candidatus Sulfotelmatobacter sp.]
MQRIRCRLQPAVWRVAARCGILSRMTNKTATFLLALLILMSSAALLKSATPPAVNAPEYTSDGQLQKPENYRQWVYLTTGFDMSYTANAMAMDHHMFDNVFVNPEAYNAFLETGTWPDKTMLVLEVRKAQDRGSINQRGNFQTTDVMGLEVHVKDQARFPDKWAFFGFDDAKTAKMTPTTMPCYSCHSDHGAVDTTFVQFYPTLLPIAQAKGTLSAGYVKEGK